MFLANRAGIDPPQEQVTPEQKRELAIIEQLESLTAPSGGLYAK